ncbi:MAG: hypothetical protein BGN92_10705 [Sphingobacteriales bacterium 41-5]|nr:MAG: hypothetical protein BGN92_10705 [Sphingobacteriales bacterium 41-5]
MPSATNISLSVSPEQVFSLAQKLKQKDKVKLIRMLEQQQYVEDIPEAHKKLVRKRIKKYTRQPEKLVDEKDAVEQLNAL